MKIEGAECAKKVTPSWHEVKARLVEFDQVGILALMHDLYSSSIPLELLPKKGKRLIYAYHLNDPLDAAPADVIMVEEGKSIPKLMLPKGEFRFAFED